MTEREDSGNLGEWGVDAVRLFEVYNTSHRPIFVLARDQATALSFAWAAGHIRHTDKGLEGEGRGAHEVKFAASRPEFRGHWQSLQTAAREMAEGVVRFEEERLVIGTRVIKE